LLHVLFGGAVIQDAAAQGEPAADGRVREMGAAGALHRPHDALIVGIGADKTKT
jgi:hypothetical protein